MLCLVFESLSPGSGAAIVAYLLPRPPTLCAVEGVTLKYSLSYILVDFSFSFSRDAMFQVIRPRMCITFYPPSLPPSIWKSQANDKRLLLYLLVFIRRHLHNFSG